MFDRSRPALKPETLQVRPFAELLGLLRTLRAEVAVDGESTLAAWPRDIPRHAFKLGSANLAHYLALRRRDLRDLQDELTLLGLPSLGRLEGRVLANLDAVIAALAPHADERAPYPSARAFYRGQRLLERNSTELFGRSRLRRAIMVTLGMEAQDADYVRDLARHGMDVARINGAHDAPDVWARLVANVRRAGQTERRDLRILFDLAGPSCRTGEVASAGRGRLKSGDRLILVRDLASDLPHFPHQVCCTLPEVLDKLAPGHAIRLDDGKLQGTVEERSREGVVVRVVRTGPKGVKLKPEKGLVFPDTELGLAPLMLADLAALDFAMPEMQEELLWLCEAAHVPVVWATEVLENLRKKGIFVRGEMTDAAMSGRAECVMLNKGPYLGQSIDVLQGLLMRMSEHQNKKTPRLRALHAWEREPGEAE